MIKVDTNEALDYHLRTNRGDIVDFPDFLGVQCSACHNTVLMRDEDTSSFRMSLIQKGWRIRRKRWICKDC